LVERAAIMQGRGSSVRFQPLFPQPPAHLAGLAATRPTEARTPTAAPTSKVVPAKVLDKAYASAPGHPPRAGAKSALSVEVQLCDSRGAAPPEGLTERANRGSFCLSS
jgi:hypothetical protein